MSGLFGMFERRSPNVAFESPTHPLTSTALVDLLNGGTVEAGVRVNEDTALKHAAVWRAIWVVANLTGALPLHTYKAGTKQRTDSILDDPHPEMTALEWKKLTGVHRGLYGDFFAQKIRDGAGQVRWLFPMNPDPKKMQVGRGRPIEENPSGKVFKFTDSDGSIREWTSYEVFHVPGLGYDGLRGVSPIKYAARGIALGLAAEQHGAKLFESGNLLSGLLKTPGKLDQTQAEALQARWKAKLKDPDSAHSVAVLDSGAEFQSLTMPNDDAQLLGMREFSVQDMGRRWGVPPFLMMSTEKSTSWGTGLEQQMTGFTTVDLGPAWLQPLEARANKELLRTEEKYAKYSLQGLLRGDAKTRAEFYRAMIELGIMSPNEIRDLEEMERIGAEGDIHLQPLNYAPLGTMPNTNGGSE